MAQLNVRPDWWTDPRRDKLASTVGNSYLADGIAVRAWMLAQRHWKENRQLVPESVFSALEFSNALLESGLAEKTADGVYIKGSREHLEWTAELIEKRRQAGKRSAEVRREKNGTAVPKNATNSEQAPNTSRTNGNKSELYGYGYDYDYGKGDNSQGQPASNIIHPAQLQETRLKHAPELSRIANSLAQAFSEDVDKPDSKQVPPKLLQQSFLAKMLRFYGSVDAVENHIESIMRDPKADPKKNPGWRNHIETRVWFSIKDCEGSK